MASEMASIGKHPPAFLRLRSSKTFIILTVSAAIFTDLFIYGLVVPILPFALESRLRIQSADIQKWISIFLAVYGGALLCAAPVCGWFADRVSSRRIPMLFGLVAQIGSTTMLCVAQSITVMIVGRVLQGVSAAIVWGVGLALLVDTMGVGGIGLAMGYVGLGMSLAVLAAPLLGGVVFEKAGYYAVFAMAFGLIVVDVILRLVMVERKVAEKWLPDPSVQDIPTVSAESRRSPMTGTAPCDKIPTEEKIESHATLNSLGEELGVRRNAPENPEAGRREACARTSRVQVPSFILLLASRRLLSALWCCMAQTIVYTSMDTILPLFVKDVFRWTARGAGLIFLPIVLGSFLNPLVGHLCDRYGPRWFATLGSLLACPCLILLRLIHEDTTLHKILLCVLLSALGVCLNLVMPPMMAEITYVVEEKSRRRPQGYFGKYGAYAQAYSLFNVAWSAGGMIGPLLGGFTNQTVGWKATTLLLGCIAAFTTLPAMIWTGGSIFKKRSCTCEGDGGC